MTSAFILQPSSFAGTNAAVTINTNTGQISNLGFSTSGPGLSWSNTATGAWGQIPTNGHIHITDEHGSTYDLRTNGDITLSNLSGSCVILSNGNIQASGNAVISNSLTVYSAAGGDTIDTYSPLMSSGNDVSQKWFSRPVSFATEIAEMNTGGLWFPSTAYGINVAGTIYGNNIVGTNFTGNGGGLTSLQIANLTNGTLNTNQMPSGLAILVQHMTGTPTLATNVGGSSNNLIHNTGDISATVVTYFTNGPSGAGTEIFTGTFATPWPAPPVCTVGGGIATSYNDNFSPGRTFVVTTTTTTWSVYLNGATAPATGNYYTNYFSFSP